MVKRYDLCQDWTFKSKNSLYKGQTSLPSCNYLYLMQNGYIKDPFFDTNEEDLIWVAELDWIYEKTFEVDDKLLAHKSVVLNLENVDTIADVYINDVLEFELSNMHILYSFDIKEKLRLGQNTIKIYIHSPIKEAKKRRKLTKTPPHAGISGFSLIRKPAYHFGWDWGPTLPPSGVKAVYLTLISDDFIENIYVNTTLIENRAKLKIETNINGKRDDYGLRLNLFDPSGKLCATTVAEYLTKEDNYTSIFADIEVENPILWQPNTIREELNKLYTLECIMLRKGKEIDRKSQKIGIATIELSLKKEDKPDFCFVVNKKRIFAKGANWIPSDSFVERVTDEALEHFVKSIADSNFNMLRIWGGGFYASDRLMELCDKYGILVWHDFMFACAPYPFNDDEFLRSSLLEAEQNIKRLRSHPSLALFCGNNEIEAMSLGWFGYKNMMEANREFFYVRLKTLVNSLTTLPYWAGSPSSGVFRKDMASDDVGDTHIWNVWHGMKPFKYFLTRKTLFCSEFGFESLPTFDTIKKIVKSESDLRLDSAVMRSHQKCPSGNDRMRYYMIDNYGINNNFKHLIYLSQLTQAQSIRVAVEHWRRNLGRCNGAIYWQLNDCWPTFSWSSIDYNGNYKALQYFAKEFYKPLMLSLQIGKEKAEVYVINDSLKDFKGSLKCQIKTFNGLVVREFLKKVDTNGYEVKMPLTIPIDKASLGLKKKKVYLSVSLRDEEGAIKDRKCYLLVKEKKCKLLKPNFYYNLDEVDGMFRLTLKSDTFVRNAMVEMEGLSSQFSDNFFDMEAGREYKIYAKKTEEEGVLNITSYKSIDKRYSRLTEILIKLKIRLRPINFFNSIIYKFM